MRYNLEWDPRKAQENLRKHGVSLEQAAELFLDPMAVSAFDADHSEDEERWVTMGSDSRGRVLVLVHTFVEVSPGQAKIRMISARKATKSEARHYEDIER